MIRRHPRPPSPLRAATALVVAAAAVLIGAVASQSAYATGGGDGSARSWPYWKTELHAHSTVSGDGTTDNGIIAAAAKDLGFNAVFMTDHTAGAYNPTGGVVSSHLSFEDDSGANRQWEDEPSNPTATAAAGLSTEHVLSGSNSYKVSISSPGEAFGWIKRGANQNAGQITMKFNVFPTQLEPGAGLYVSASMGGDPTVPGRFSDGYTTADGTVLPGHSTTLVWQLGTPRADSDDGTTRVITHPLSYTLDTWNTYTIDVSSAIEAAFPDPAKRPGDLNGLLYIKMAGASASGATATGYFDALTIDAANAPTKSAGAAAAAAADFVERNQTIHNWDTPSFTLVPGEEVGFNDHVQRFHYPITDVSQWQQFSKGTDGVAPVQAAGFPVQLNHPGLPGGVTNEEAISTSAYGADAMEAVERGTNDIMIRDWDAILHNGEPLIGTWTSDAHKNSSFGPATFLQSPALDELSLLRSLFEGRGFMAPVWFSGTASFTPDAQGGSYPARYPLYRSAESTLGTVHLSITDGLRGGDRVVWLRDGVVVRSDDVTGTSYDDSLVLSLPTTSTPVRAEVRHADGLRGLMTEPIMMRTVAGLPHGVTVHVEQVATPSGTGYTKGTVRGITNVAYDSGTGVLTSTLQNPAGSTVEQVVATASKLPSSVSVDGQALPQVANRPALEAGTTDGWAYDSARHELVVKATHSGATGSLQVTLVPGSDTVAPSVPQVTAVAQDAGHVHLEWPAADDDTGVTQYIVRRNGDILSSLPGTARSYEDTTVTPDTAYDYSVVAMDASQNASAPGLASVRTQPVVTTVLSPVADTYASSSAPSTNYGTAKIMKADSSPETNSYLRFAMPSNMGQLFSATVKLTSSASLPGGVRFRALTDHSWGERTLTFSNAPALGAVVGTSPSLTGGTAVSTDVTSYARTAGSTLDLGISNPSSTNVSLYTRENGASVPQLTLISSLIAPYASDVSVTTPEDVPVSFTPTVYGGTGPLTCSISSPPATGTVWVASDCSRGDITPSKDATGTDSFTYDATDGTQTATGRVTFTTTPVNDAPATDAEVLGSGTDEDTPVTLTLRGSDVDGDCPLAFAVTALPMHGSLGALSPPSCANGEASATATYSPDANFSGTDALSFKVTDPSGASSSPASVSIAVAPVDDPPTAGAVSIRANSGQTVPWSPVVSDVDSTGLSCSIGTAPTKGTATVTANCNSGSYTAGLLASGSDSFSYAVGDGTSTRTAIVTVSLNASTSPPTASPTSVDTAQQSQVSVPLAGSDPDAQCPLTFAVVSPPAHGSVGTPAAGSCSAGNQSGSVIYTPVDGYGGPDSFTYRVTDPQGETSSPATVSITVTPPLFADGFESGTLGAWTKSVGATVRTTTPRTGTYALDLDSSAGGPSYARKTLPGTLTTTETTTGVRLLTAPTSGATALIRMRAADDTALVTVSLDSLGRLKLRNEITRTTQSSTTALPVGSWAVLTLRVTTSGANSTMQVLLDGVAVPGLSSTSDLGTYRVAVVQLGDNAKGPTGRELVDDVRVTGA